MTTSVVTISASEFLAVTRQSCRLFLKHWWKWPLIMILSFAPAFVGAVLPFDPIFKKGFVLFGASLAGIIATAFAFCHYKMETLVNCVKESWWRLFGIALFSLVSSLAIWKLIELPALSLFATAGEMAVYSGDAVSTDAIAPRHWVDAVHSFIFIFCASPFSMASALVIMRKLGTVSAIVVSVRCFAANWAIFLSLALITTILHAFIQEPKWFLFVQLAIYMFVVTPVLTTVNVVMADQMTCA